VLWFGGGREMRTQMQNSRLEVDGNLTGGLLDNTATKGAAKPEIHKLN